MRHHLGTHCNTTAVASEYFLANIRRYSIHQICIPASQIMRHASGIHGVSSRFYSQLFHSLCLMFSHMLQLQSCQVWCFGKDLKWTLTSCNWLWMYHSSPARSECDKSALNYHVCSAIVHLVWPIASFLSLFLRLWFGGGGTHRVSSLTIPHI